MTVALSMKPAVLPPTAGTTDVDEDLGLDVVTAERAWIPGPLLSNSFGFGGHTATLLLVPSS